MTDDELLTALYQRTLDAFFVDPGNAALYQPLFRTRPTDDLPPDPLPQLRRPVLRGGNSSVQLFSGLRGTGKTTQLRRLQLELERGGTSVVMLDVLAYLSVTEPIDPSSFLLMLAGAVSDACDKDNHLLGADPRRQSYWSRFLAFAQETKLDLDSLSFRAAPSDLAGMAAELKFKLHREQNVRKRLRELSSAHAGALAADVHAYLGEIAYAVRKKRGDMAHPLVLIVDSFEKLYGDGRNDDDVYRAAGALFRAHADKLRIPEWHVVYTVPPWLQLGIGGAAAAYDQTYMLPCVKVRDRRKARDGATAGIDALLSLIRKRVPEIDRVVPERGLQERLARASGGYLREFLRLFRECVGPAEEFGLPLDAAAVDAVIDKVRNDYRQVADADVAWLARVAETGDVELPSFEELPRLARFFDNHLLLAYQNGEAWFDVHAIIAEHVDERRKLIEARAPEAGREGEAGRDGEAD